MDYASGNILPTDDEKLEIIRRQYKGVFTIDQSWSDTTPKFMDLQMSDYVFNAFDVEKSI